MIFNKISAHLLFFFMLSFIAIEPLEKLHSGKGEVMPDNTEVANADQWLHANYRRGESGHLELMMSGTYSVLKCTLAGWRVQDLHFNSNLAALADGCILVE